MWFMRKEKKIIEKLILEYISEPKLNDDIIKYIVSQGYDESNVRHIWLKLMRTDKVNFDRKTKEFYLNREYDDNNVLGGLFDILFVPGELSALLFILCLPFVIIYYLFKYFLKVIKRYV